MLIITIAARLAYSLTSFSVITCSKLDTLGPVSLGATTKVVLHVSGQG